MKAIYMSATKAEKKTLNERIKYLKECISYGAYQSASTAAQNLATHLQILSDKYQVNVEVVEQAKRSAK